MQACRSETRALAVLGLRRGSSYEASAAGMGWQEFDRAEMGQDAHTPEGHLRGCNAIERGSPIKRRARTRCFCLHPRLQTVTYIISIALLCVALSHDKCDRQIHFLDSILGLLQK